MTYEKPTVKPHCADFSSGPCAKYPGWDIGHLHLDCLGRSHRSTLAKQRLQQVIDHTRRILDIPADYRIGIVPASDTGAVEMALWSVLHNGVGADVYAWESFGSGWASDITQQLKLTDCNIIRAPYGDLPELVHTADRDMVFTYNGTTSGVRVPNTDWISTERTGVTLCDATSAVFVENLDWQKLDITTWSWQKALGGEGAHGMIVLSPHAVARIEAANHTYRPLPKIFRMCKNGTLIEGIFKGATINTPSMLCVEDLLACYRWVDKIGGQSALQRRSYENLAVLTDWVDRTDWVRFLATDAATRSSTAMCLVLQNAKVAKPLCALLENCDVAYDIGAYRDAPAGLRIWGGPTVETQDIRILTEWIEWAYHTVQT